MEKLLKGFINLKAWLLISVHIDETERIMRTQKSLLILHAVQQECLNVWICLCGLISFLNALGLEIEALAAVDRGIRSESLLGEDQVADPRRSPDMRAMRYRSRYLSGGCLTAGSCP